MKVLEFAFQDSRLNRIIKTALMKKFFFIFLIISSIIGCKCKKTAVDNMQKHTTIIMNDCLADAKCTFETYKDSALLIEIDDATQKPYYTINPQKGTTVYRYEMSENVDPQYMDGGYREEIIFQLPSDFKEGIINGKDLINTKALFGVFCYCKGKAGYYTIEEGTITKTKKSIHVEIPALVEGQKVRVISF